MYSEIKEQSDGRIVIIEGTWSGVLWVFYLPCVYIMGVFISNGMDLSAIIMGMLILGFSLFYLNHISIESFTIDNKIQSVIIKKRFSSIEENISFSNIKDVVLYESDDGEECLMSHLYLLLIVGEPIRIFVGCSGVADVVARRVGYIIDKQCTMTRSWPRY